MLRVSVSRGVACVRRLSSPATLGRLDCRCARSGVVLLADAGRGLELQGHNRNHRPALTQLKSRPRRVASSDDVSWLAHGGLSFAGACWSLSGVPVAVPRPSRAAKPEFDFRPRADAI